MYLKNGFKLNKEPRIQIVEVYELTDMENPCQLLPMISELGFVSAVIDYKVASQNFYSVTRLC